MRPSTSPSLTLRSRPATACRPPKRLDRPRVSSSVMGSRPSSSPKHPRETWIGPFGQKQDDGDQKNAVDDEMRAVPAALREVVTRHLRERAQNEGPEDRSEHRAG